MAGPRALGPEAPTVWKHDVEPPLPQPPDLREVAWEAVLPLGARQTHAAPTSPESVSVSASALRSLKISAGEVTRQRIA